MQNDIHPSYGQSVIICTGCKTTYTTLGTQPEMKVEICANCHPFYTGKRQLVDTAGQIDLYKRRAEIGKKHEEQEAKKKAKKEAKEKARKEHNASIDRATTNEELLEKVRVQLQKESDKQSAVKKAGKNKKDAKKKKKVE